MEENLTKTQTTKKKKKDLDYWLNVLCSKYIFFNLTFCGFLHFRSHRVKSQDELWENGTKESRKEATGVSAGAGGQNSKS